MNKHLKIQKIQKRIKERLERSKVKNGCDIGDALPNHLYPYKCTVCGKSLLPDWVESDCDKDIAHFNKNDKLYDVCVTCSVEMGLISKLDLNSVKEGDIIGSQYIDGQFTPIYYKE